MSEKATITITVAGAGGPGSGAGAGGVAGPSGEGSTESRVPKKHMRVRELIAALQQFDGEEFVGIYDNGPGDGANEIIEVELTEESLEQRVDDPYKFDRKRIVLIRMDGHA